MNTSLQAARKRAGLTQVEVAEKADISEISYQRIEYELQRPSLNTAMKIARVLNCSVEQLFSIVFTTKRVSKKKSDGNQT